MEPLNELSDGEISPVMSKDAAITGEGMSNVAMSAKMQSNIMYTNSYNDIQILRNESRVRIDVTGPFSNDCVFNPRSGDEGPQIPQQAPAVQQSKPQNPIQHKWNVIPCVLLLAFLGIAAFYIYIRITTLRSEREGF